MTRPNNEGDPTVADVLFDYERAIVEHYEDDWRVDFTIWRLEREVAPLLGRWRLSEVDEFALAGFARICRAYSPNPDGTLKSLANALCFAGADRLAVELALGLRTRDVDDG